jgi:hypothetical protein
MTEILIDSKGIRRALKKYNYAQAISEYIWNGFDAGATEINIDYVANEIGSILDFSIQDNGNGIPYIKLGEKFRPFLRSEKEINPDQIRMSSSVHGINGVGRLTFFKFALKATWQTVYEEEGRRFTYEIRVDSSCLNHYEATPEKDTNNPIGTKVIFTDIIEFSSENIDNEISLYLIHEFCWYLKLHASQNYRIKINGKPINISTEIEDEDEFNYVANDGKYKFTGRFIQWKEKLRTEYSRNYFLDSNFHERFKKTTTLNNKGDSFYHSLYIQSSFFDNVDLLESEEENTEDGQLKLQFASDSQKEIFSGLSKEIDSFLKLKRSPYIKKLSIKLVKDYSDRGIFPKFSQDEWGKSRESELKSFVRELYIVEPKMFSRLNDEQQKSFVLLLNLIMDSDEKDELLKIIDEIVSLSPDERKQLSEVLKTTKLSNITKTINLIQDRIRAVSELRQLIQKDFKASESKHIQRFIEAHYWLFGEQYHLATAEEPDFEEALRRYLFLTTGEDAKQILEHQDKNKEMDIFAVRKIRGADEIENIVIELKSPKVLLGEKELSQVKSYLRIIKSDARFNGSNTHWTFILVGNKFDTSGYIEGEIETNKNHGAKFLVHYVGNSKIFVMKWSEVISSFELRYSHLIDELKVERERLIKKYNNADDMIDAISSNTAAYVKSELTPIP